MKNIKILINILVTIFITGLVGLLVIVLLDATGVEPLKFPQELLILGAKILGFLLGVVISLAILQGIFGLFKKSANTRTFWEKIIAFFLKLCFVALAFWLLYLAYSCVPQGALSLVILVPMVLLGLSFWVIWSEKHFEEAYPKKDMLKSLYKKWAKRILIVPGAALFFSVVLYIYNMEVLATSLFVVAVLSFLFVLFVSSQTMLSFLDKDNVYIIKGYWGGLDFLGEGRHVYPFSFDIGFWFEKVYQVRTSDLEFMLEAGDINPIFNSEEKDLEIFFGKGYLKNPTLKIVAELIKATVMVVTPTIRLNVKFSDDDRKELDTFVKLFVKDGEEIESLEGLGVAGLVEMQSRLEKAFVEIMNSILGGISTIEFLLNLKKYQNIAHLIFQMYLGEKKEKIVRLAKKLKIDPSDPAVKSAFKVFNTFDWASFPPANVKVTSAALDFRYSHESQKTLDTFRSTYSKINITSGVFAKLEGESNEAYAIRLEALKFVVGGEGSLKILTGGGATPNLLTGKK